MDNPLAGVVLLRRKRLHGLKSGPDTLAGRGERSGKRASYGSCKSRRKHAHGPKNEKGVWLKNEAHLDGLVRKVKRESEKSLSGVARQGRVLEVTD